MQHLVTSEAELEALYGRPAGPAVIKEIGHISEHYRRFIEVSPFVVLATSGPRGSTARRVAIRRASCGWSTRAP